MRLYNNPWVAVVYLLGSGAKSIKNKIENAEKERDKRKTLESAINFLSSSEEERKRRCEIAEKREKWAIRSAITVFVYLFVSFLICFIPDGQYFDLPPVLAGIIVLIFFLPCILSIIYGLWYSLYGKYL